MRLLAGAKFQEVPGNGWQPEVNPELRKLGLDLPSTPVILGGHPGDQGLGLLRDRRTTGAGPRDPAPVAAECLAVPTNDGLRPHQDQGGSPLRPDAREGHPKGSVQRRESGPRVAVGADRKLLAERQLDDGLALAASEEAERAAKHANDEGEQRPKRRRILAAGVVEWEPESRAAVDLSSMNEEAAS
jgi:hypothetical protein